jgi:mannose-1-phosphate guanylyltransferase
MKAFLLAAGLGTRLQPITNTLPKCLVPIAGKPVLAYWFDLFRKHSINEVLINLNHFPDQVIEYIQNHISDVKVTLVREDVLLGSLGTLLQNKSFIGIEKNFFVFYADTLTNVDLQEMLQIHNNSNMPFTIGLFHAKDPQSCGIVSLNECGTVVDFEEKPINPKSDLANAGMYIMDTAVLFNMKFPKASLLDIGYDLLPKLIYQMQGFIIKDFVLDIGTHANLQFAEKFLTSNPKEFIKG